MLESDVQAPPSPPATCKDLKGKRAARGLLGIVVRLSFPGWRALEHPRHPCTATPPKPAPNALGRWRGPGCEPLRREN